jgi:hypothetical protein
MNELVQETIRLLEEVGAHLDDAPEDMTEAIENRLRTLHGVASDLNLRVVP